MLNHKKLYPYIQYLQYIQLYAKYIHLFAGAYSLFLLSFDNISAAMRNFYINGSFLKSTSTELKPSLEKTNLEFEMLSKNTAIIDCNEVQFNLTTYIKNFKIGGKDFDIDCAEISPFNQKSDRSILKIPGRGQFYQDPKFLKELLQYASEEAKVITYNRPGTGNSKKKHHRDDFTVKDSGAIAHEMLKTTNPNYATSNSLGGQDLRYALFTHWGSFRKKYFGIDHGKVIVSNSFGDFCDVVPETPSHYVKTRYNQFDHTQFSDLLNKALPIDVLLYHSLIKILDLTSAVIFNITFNNKDNCPNIPPIFDRLTSDKHMIANRHGDEAIPLKHQLAYSISAKSEECSHAEMTLHSKHSQQNVDWETYLFILTSKVSIHALSFYLSYKYLGHKIIISSYTIYLAFQSFSQFFENDGNDKNDNPSINTLGSKCPLYDAMFSSTEPPHQASEDKVFNHKGNTFIECAKDFFFGNNEEIAEAIEIN